MKLPQLEPADVRRALGPNRHFVGLLVGLLVVLTAFPGSPARALVDQIVGAPATAPPPQLPPAAGPGAPPAFGGATVDPVGPGTAGPTPPPQLVDPTELPPAEPEEPAPVCSTDLATDLVDQVRDPIAAALGQPLPDDSVDQLIQIAAGCSTVAPEIAVLDLALELAEAFPRTGLEIIDLPDLPGVDASVPPAVVELLAPVAPTIRDGCSNLATVALVFVVLPPAFGLPFSQSDLIQFLGPATALCALFDEPVA